VNALMALVGAILFGAAVTAEGATGSMFRPEQIQGAFRAK